MAYNVEQIQENRKGFSSYRYRIFRGNTEFAIFSHDYRGECEYIKVLSSGRLEALPFGFSHEFLTGGGPLPLGLSEAAKRYLDSLPG